MRFKLDENLATACAQLLREAGHDAMTVGEQGLSGTPDGELAAICQAEARILVTADLDLSDVRDLVGTRFAGHIVLRLNDQSESRQVATFARILVLLQSEVIENRLWIVDDHRVRIRTI